MAERGQSLKIRQFFATLAKLQGRSAKTTTDFGGVVVEVHFKSGYSFPETNQFIRGRQANSRDLRRNAARKGR